MIKIIEVIWESHPNSVIWWVKSIVLVYCFHTEGLRQLVWTTPSEVNVAQSNSLLYSTGDSPGQNTRVGRLSLLQGIFPTRRLNPGLPHCRQILYQLSHNGSPRILEWVAYPFSRGSSWSGIEPGSPALQADSLSTELCGNRKILEAVAQQCECI